MKYILFFLVVSFIPIFCDECGTPLECFNKALILLTDERQKFQATEATLQQTIHELNNQITTLKSQIASQNQVIENYHSQCENYHSQLTQQIVATQNSLNSFANNVNSRGLTNLRISGGPREFQIRFDGFPYYGFYNDDRNFGMCDMTGNNCKFA